MTFLTPAPALIAAALAVPLLLLLYFLKLRRRAVRIPSTLLWQQAYRDLQVNVPFQRLRFSSLLILQLLVIAALLLALAQPVASGAARVASRIVLLIDQSASMSATDGPDGTSRLDAAKSAATRIIEEADRAAAPAQVMIVAFATGARVVSGFEGRPALLLDALETIEPTDAAADLQRAFNLAEAFGGRGTDELAATDRVAVVLLSDGGVAPPENPRGFTLQADDFRFVQCGPAADADAATPVDNIGIVAFSARRDFEEPESVVVFARLINTSGEPREVVLTFLRDGEPAGLRRVTVPGANDTGPGEASATLALEIPGGAVLSLQHNHADVLRADDGAWLVLPPPSAPRVAVVTGTDGADPFVLDALEAMQPRELTAMNVTQFQELDAEGGLIDAYDLIVFDRVHDHRLPPVPSLTLGGVPAGFETTPDPPDTGRRLVTWERQAPILRHVALNEVVYTGFGAYRLPPEARALVTGPEGPVIASVRSRGVEHVLVGFEMTASTWPIQVSFTVFMQNVLSTLAAGGADDAGGGIIASPGTSLVVRPERGRETLIIRGPLTDTDREPAETTIDLRDSETSAAITMPARVGLYAIDGARRPQQAVGVSMLDDVESDTRPRGQITVNARSVSAGATDDAAPRHLWPWLVAVAGLLMLLEWGMYVWQMRSA